MNTPPDDTTLALWLDDELEGEELARVEAWAADQPEQLAAREEVRRWRKMISESLPAAQEPPAGEFFNERIQHAIREAATNPVQARNSSSWSRLWMPLAACAGMVLAFWLGGLIQPQDGSLAGDTDDSGPVTPHLYTPEEGVDARWISSTDASATVIVLNGVNAIPDEVDFTATALHRGWREIDSTAAKEPATESQ